MTTASFETAPLLTEGEVAAWLRVAPQTLRRWRVQGRGPAFLKVGAAVRYEHGAVRGYLAENRHGSTSDIQS